MAEEMAVQLFLFPNAEEEKKKAKRKRASRRIANLRPANGRIKPDQGQSNFRLDISNFAACFGDGASLPLRAEGILSDFGGWDSGADLLSLIVRSMIARSREFEKLREREDMAAGRDRSFEAGRFQMPAPRDRGRWNGLLAAGKHHGPLAWIVSGVSFLFRYRRLLPDRRESIGTLLVPAKGKMGMNRRHLF